MRCPRFDDYPRAERRFSYPETSLREPGPERRSIPASGLQGKRCPRVVPGHQALGFGVAKSAPPPLDEPPRMRLSRIPHPASRIPTQLPQHPVYVARGPFARELPRQLHAGRHRGVRRYPRQRAQLVGPEPEDIVEARIDGCELEQPIELGAAPQHAGRQLVGEAAVALDQVRERSIAGALEGRTRPHCVEHLQCGAPGGRGVLKSSILSSGEDATATSRLGMRPARYDVRPASTASRMARAIATGSRAAAIAVFIKIPSTPCSMVGHASDAVPTPASTTTGTLSRRLIVRTPTGFKRPSPLPMGEASGITAAQPASSRRRAVTRSSLV